jgi:Uma2 family endonuclease
MATVSAARPLEPHMSSPFPEQLERLSIRIPTSAATLEGFREWATSPTFPENLRAAFIEREIFLDMSNEDPELHVMVKTVVTSRLFQINQEKKLGRLYADGMQVVNREAELANNPDASFASWKSLRSGRVRITRRRGAPAHYKDMEGSPDWVLEVLSDSSVEKDTQRLRRAYHRAGVSEYWIVDARGEEVILQILYRRKRGYVAAPVKDGWQRSPVFGCEFRLTRQQVELELWDYTLDMRPC